MSENIFEYAMLKSETNSEVMFFIRVLDVWINREIDLSYDDKQIIIELNNQNFTSGILPKIAQDWLNHNSSKVYFTNNDGIIILETKVEQEVKEIYGTEN